MTALFSKTKNVRECLLLAGSLMLMSTNALAAPTAAPAPAPVAAASQSRIPSMVSSTPNWVGQPAAQSAPSNVGTQPGVTPTPGTPLVTAAATPKAKVFSDQESLLLGVLQNINPPGWVPSPARIFSANAVTIGAPTADPILPLTQLYSELDASKVGILQEFGCAKVFERGFQRGQRNINARVYVFNTVNGAYGGYMLMRQGAANVIVRGDASSEDQDSISFWQGRTLVTINGPQDDEESKAVVTSMADKLAAISREHGQLPDVLERMPKLGRVKGSERVVMGPLSASRFIRAPYLNSLNFSRALCCGVADYQVQEPPDRLKVMNLEFATPQEAMLAYNSYSLNFGGRQIQVAAPFGGMCSLYKTNKTYLLFQQKGRQFTIVANARRAESAEYLARFMY